MTDGAGGRLRAMFADELADHVGALERAIASAARLVSPEDEPARAELVVEIFRSAHTLKGAARVVGESAIERVCHTLETRLGPARALGGASLPRAILDTQTVLPAFRDSAARLARGQNVDAAMLSRAHDALLAATDEPASLVVPTAPESPSAVVPSDRPPIAARAADHTSADRTAPKPADANTRSGRADPVAEAGAEREGTMRVAVSSVAALLEAAQELQSLTSRTGAGRSDALETAVADLEARLLRAQRLARASARARGEESELVNALEGATDALRAVTHTARAQRLSFVRSWTAAKSVAVRVTERSRALRVRSVGSLSAPLEAAALEAASSLGKSVTVTFTGEHHEVDRRVLDALREPLLHLVRNAIDHGLETPAERLAKGKSAEGALAIRAILSGVELTIEVRDDGRGIDVNAVRERARSLGLDPGTSERDALGALFEAGFTTRDQATALSGRGVGLDVVRQRVAQLHGRVEVETRRGAETTFRVVVPSDLSVTRGLVVRARDTHVVVPTSAVRRLVRIADTELVSLDGRHHVPTESGPVPLSDLDALLGMSPRARGLESVRRPVLVLGVAERVVALRVDALIDEREVVVQGLEARLARLPFVSGGVVLEGGELALLLDVGDVARLARADVVPPLASARRAVRVLLVDDSVTTRQLERSLLEAAGYDVAVAADGLEAWSLLGGETEFDAVITDVEMPRLDGFALLSRVRGTPRLARLPVILVTALASDDDRRRGLELGASAYLSKGAFDEDALLDALEDLT